MKPLPSKLIIYLGIFALLLGTITTFAITPSYAANLQIIGNDLGLEVTPTNTKLFDLTNMNPGDTKEAAIYIKNNNKCKLELYIRTERISPLPLEDEADLFKKMILTIYYGDDIIYHGSMESFAKENTNLGEIYPNSEKELRAIVHLPGPETGNEFQGKSVDVNWIFTAEQRCQPEIPEEPKEPQTPTEPTDPTDPNEPEEKPTEIASEPEIPKLQDQPGDLKIPDDEDEEIVEIIEDPIPVANIEAEPNIPASSPKLPRTGAAPGVLYYAIGSLLLAIGIKMNKEEE